VIFPGALANRGVSGLVGGGSFPRSGDQVSLPAGVSATGKLARPG
jgi:hypothetical protein